MGIPCKCSRYKETQQTHIDGDVEENDNNKLIFNLASTSVQQFSVSENNGNDGAEGEEWNSRGGGQCPAKLSKHFSTKYQRSVILRQISGLDVRNGRPSTFLVTFFNLIQAFIVNRCRHDKGFSISQPLIRQPLCFYAASTFLLMLCCLVTSTRANDSAAVHPM